MGKTKIESRLKKNNFLRRQVKRIKNRREFLGDASDFNRYYLETAETRGDFRYRLMLLVHSIEKGLCSAIPRPFGEDKARRIFEIIKNNPEKSGEFEYRLARSILKEWKGFYLEQGWDVPGDLFEFIDTLKSDVKSGYSLFEYSGEAELLSRRSVRDFDNRELKQEDIDFALEYFKMAPTACNRQMCRVYFAKSPSAKKLLIDNVLGISGFNTEAVNFFFVTFDISAFDYYGERNQGYLNAGLTAMNFVNGLHLKGIGSCFLQWSNNRSTDKLVCKELGLSPSERIAVVIGAGYYKNGVKTPESARKNKDMIYKEI